LLSRVKADVVNRLRERGYDIPEEAVKAGNENRYIAIVLAYESLYPADQALRPELLIEISARPPILTPVVCGYDTIVNEMLGRAARTGTIACLDIRETIGGSRGYPDPAALDAQIPGGVLLALERQSVHHGVIEAHAPPALTPAHSGRSLATT
jgi:hypothetical protein